MSVAFSTSESPLERKIDGKLSVIQATDIDTEFEIKECITWIKDNNYQRVSTVQLLYQGTWYMYLDLLIHNRDGL